VHQDDVLPLRTTTPSSTHFPFLRLPGELRNQIYGYIAIPNSAPLSSYKGLYLSCRQVKNEMDYEVVEEYQKYLQAMHLSDAAEASSDSDSSSDSEDEGEEDGPVIGASNIRPVELPMTFSEVGHLKVVVQMVLAGNKRVTARYMHKKGAYLPVSLYQFEHAEPSISLGVLGNLFYDRVTMEPWMPDRSCSTAGLTVFHNRIEGADKDRHMFLPRLIEYIMGTEYGGQKWFVLRMPKDGETWVPSRLRFRRLNRS
jgi:hypothetical protein